MSFCFSGLKKLKAQRAKEEKAKKKAEEKKAAAEAKAAAGGDKPKKANLAAAFDEEEKDPSKYTDNRKAFIQAARDAGNNPYPHKFTRTHRIDQFRREYEETVTE